MYSRNESMAVGQYSYRVFTRSREKDVFPAPRTKGIFGDDITLSAPEVTVPLAFVFGVRKEAAEP